MKTHKSKEDLENKIADLSLQLDRANEFCKNSREKFQKALMASPDPVCILDIESMALVEINSNFIDVFAYSKEDSLNKTTVDLNLWSSKEDRNHFYENIQLKGRIKNFETELLNKEGATCKTIISAEKIISDGKDCALIYLRQVNNLRETQDQYRLLAENSTDVIWVLQPDGRFTYVSPSVKKLRGYTSEEVLKQPLHEVMTEESMQKVSILLNNLLSLDNRKKAISDSFQAEIEQLCKDGSTVWTEVLVTPIKNKEGRIREVLGVSRNIQGKKIAQQRALERSRTLESIFRSSPAGVGMIVDRTISMANDKFCEMLGYNKSELIGKNARFLYENDEEYERIGRVKYKKIEEKGTGALNTRLVRKDGIVLDVHMSSSPVDINDWSKGVIFNVLDLTSIKEAESEVEFNKKKYSSLIKHINDAIFVYSWDKKGYNTFVEVNDYACKIFGYTRGEFLKLNPIDITVPEELKIHSEANKKLLESGSAIYESIHVRKDKSVFPVEVSSNIVEINNEKIILAVVRDISERKEAENALIESEAKHRRMFENSPEAMALADKLGFVTDCNPALLKVFDLKKEEVVGKHFTKITRFSPKKIPSYIKLFSKVIVGKQNLTADFEWIDRNTKPRSGIVHMTPIFEKGKVSGIQALLKDTTHQKEFEKNLILAKEKAEENDRLKTAFLETMSHELRTPLNAVIGFSNLISDEKNIDNIQEMNSYISDNGQKLLTIIESIFDLSILETKTSIIKSEEIDINKLLSELGQSMSGIIELEKKGKINTFYQPGNTGSEILIISDSLRLKQLLSNLITNAVRFTEKGSIRYGYKIIGSEIEFFVSDTGIGIPEDKTDMIFEKFQQIDSSFTRTRGGLGLGLAICKEISNLLGGNLRVESTLNEGSTFYFRIPTRPDDKNSALNGDFSLNGKCFMVVEDVESNYLYLEKLLTDSGAEVLWAQTGEEAISLASRIDSIDMILMDIRMPDINGYEITREIKKINPSVPVIAQTAYAMKNDEKDAFDAGCSAHISKPIKVSDLKNTISEFLETPSKKTLVI